MNKLNILKATSLFLAASLFTACGSGTQAKPTAGAVNLQEEWAKNESGDGFSVEFPGSPEVSRSVEATAGKEIPIVIYSYEQAGTREGEGYGYLAMLIDFQAAQVGQVDYAGAIAAGRTNLLAKTASMLDSTSPLDVPGGVGEEAMFHSDADQMKGVVRSYGVGGRVYFLIFFAKTDVYAQERLRAERFFESFSIDRD